MSATHPSTEDHHLPRLYEIRIKGRLDGKWADWLHGMTLTQADNGETVLRGLVVDQAALYGLLRRVRDLGLPLVSVRMVDSAQADGSEGGGETDHNRSNKETNA